ncbi:MAG: GTP-binding protein [Nocardioidaceae bacterium]
MRTLNLGILAHVDAGKTSLTERLLYAAGVIQQLGRVDDGTAQTDSLALERQRGITIKSAVASFAIDDVTVNLIDTPGHPDFIAEVERALRVLDGAVLVVSAVEGVQAQTRVLVRELRRQRVPTLVFVNKIDRRGARNPGLVDDLRTTLGLVPLPMGSVEHLGTRAAGSTPYDETDAGFVNRLVDVLTDNDDAVLAAYLDDTTPLPYRRLRAELGAQTRRALVHPVYLGSATTGAGVEPLMAGIAELLPGTQGQPDAPVSGAVFKVERAPTGERVAYVRMFAGTLRTRDRVRLASGGRRKITAIRVFEAGSVVRSDALVAGQIGTVWGLDSMRIGDAVGVPSRAPAAAGFAPPTLESVVVPRLAADRAALYDALTQLVDQDPLINLRSDRTSEETVVSLYGEVQKEVIRDTLADEFGIDVDFRESATICVERPTKVATVVEEMPRGRSSAHPFLAGLGLRVEPSAVGSGVAVELASVRGSLPRAFRTAIEETVPLALLHGGRYGWQVVDCAVTVVSSAYWPRQSHSHGTFDKAMSSTADDFRQQTRVVLARALRGAGTVVCEPIYRFDLEIPADTLGAVLPTLAQLRAVFDPPLLRGSSYLLEGEIPATQVQTLQECLPGLTRGEGAVTCTFDRYEAVRGGGPIRPIRPASADH